MTNTNAAAASFSPCPPHHGDARTVFVVATASNEPTPGSLVTAVPRLGRDLSGQIPLGGYRFRGSDLRRARSSVPEEIFLHCRGCRLLAVPSMSLSSVMILSSHIVWTRAAPRSRSLPRPVDLRFDRSLGESRHLGDLTVLVSLDSV